MSLRLNRAKINFLKDCLEAENNAQAIWRLPTRAGKLSRKFNDVEELFKLKAEYRQRVAEMLELYSRERYLLIGLFCIRGRFDVPSFGGQTSEKNINCPIFILSGAATRDFYGPGSDIHLDARTAEINPALASIIEHTDGLSQAHFDTLKSNLVIKNTVELQNVVSQINGIFSENLDADLRIEPSENYISVERRGSSSRGTLHELSEMLNTSHLAAPVRSILDSATSRSQGLFGWLGDLFSSSKQSMPVPEVLSDSQLQALKNSLDRPLSVVSGPPGTGKSFTIACMALQQFSLGKSVLVVSQNQHAADVVRRKLIEDMNVNPELTILGSEQGVSPLARDQIRQIMSKKPDSQLSYSSSQKRLQRAVYKKGKLVQDYSATLAKVAEHKEDIGKSFWTFNSAKQSEKTRLLQEVYEDIEQQDELIKKFVAQAISTRYSHRIERLQADPDARDSIRNFAKSLTARNQYYQENYYRSIDFEYVLSAVPFWFSSLSNLSRLLPMEAEIFDLVIIDEATQSNLASVLPALQRAKRAVIVGDTKQLRHFSFVSFDLQDQLRSKHGLHATDFSTDFRSKSSLDYAIAASNRSDNHSLLNEHFRSHPQLIAFSNLKFYESKLRIMTERPTKLSACMQTLIVNGVRLDKGVNLVEIDEILKLIKQLIEDQRKLPEAEVHSLGVLCFFSKQAETLEKKLFDVISINDLRRHNVRVGTAFSFQGEERDVMYLSCSVDANTSSSGYTYLNRNDVFNVAVTRARIQQTLILSCKPNELNSASLLREFVTFHQQYKPPGHGEPNTNRDVFQDELVLWLEKRNVSCFKNFQVAGISLDIMAVFHGRSVAIDLIGFEGELSDALSLQQFRLLQRAGLDSFLLPYKEWRDNKEEVLDLLLLRLGVLTSIDLETKFLERFDPKTDELFSQLTDGVSINSLASRFLRTDEQYALEQLNTLVANYFQFKSVLEKYFLVNELTYRRYLNAIHEVVDAGLGRLEKASVAAEIANSMFEQQRALIETGEHVDLSDVLVARQDMIDEQRFYVKQAIKENQRAFMYIERSIAKLNSLTTETSTIDSITILEELNGNLELYRGNTLKDNINAD